ncbi:MAG: PIG-L family deacetylase [Chitinophagaceae bacterium]|nr:PIG-L family deacetylase [Chitinophagaceae bacterium]
MKKKFTLFLFLVISAFAQSQSWRSYNSAEILLQLKKLKVFGSVLYIAAHPDDENTRLLAYLANEKMYRTGYLSLTRGDGGQNLIGDEQGTELGLIRTQELLAARRIDGAEQFFSRAYDFGFCKHTEEALEKWNKPLILSDVVWVIRKFRPDVIITRFPEDGRAGHGHHSASAVLAHEAFFAAADSTKFPEQFTFGVKPWKTERILWNTYNFGSNNTQSEDQFKVDVGGYNALLGKSYGEIAAESRTQHKSQGFGVSAQRGSAYEYFITTAGSAPKTDLMDGIETSVRRVKAPGFSEADMERSIDSLISNFSYEHPERSVPGLAKLYTGILASSMDDYWKKQKSVLVHKLIEICAGVFFEATTDVPFVAAGDSLKINVNIVNRGGLDIQSPSVNLFHQPIPSPLPTNEAITFSKKLFVLVNMNYTQPYWLEKGLNGGHFIVDDQNLIGLPETPAPFNITLSMQINGQPFVFSKPVRYKHTDPVNGEIYQPLVVVPALSLSESPRFVFTHLNKKAPAPVKLGVTALSDIKNARAEYYQYEYKGDELIKQAVETDNNFSLPKGGVTSYTLNTQQILKNTREKHLMFFSNLTAKYKERYQSYTIRRIEYPHIPSISYLYLNKVKVIDDEIITAGKKIGYINGAGDKIPDALKDLGYDVTFLTEADILTGNLAQYDAIVTGVRAYNIHDWLNNVYDTLMKYVSNGGNLVVQYNTSNYIGPVKARMGPYPFDISRTRVTDENAQVSFLQKDDLVLNWPNKISAKDFDNWIQERGIYFAAQAGAEYKSILAMNDPGEEPATGSLIVANHGKGRFIYTGLVFFRQLPAGVGGAYRLFANLVANPNYKKVNGTAKQK